MPATAPTGWNVPTAAPAGPSPSGRSRTIDAGQLRGAGAAMLAVAVAMPWLPHGPGLPCPLRTVTGVPCPLCGMTRAVTMAVHGDLGASLAMSPGGIVAVVAALVLLVAWRVRRIAIPGWAIPLTLGALWVYQLAKYATGRPL